MNDNNEERREDRNRKISLEDDKSILEERIDLFEKSLANTGIGLKLTREEIIHIITCYLCRHFSTYETGTAHYFSNKASFQIL